MEPGPIIIFHVYYILYRIIPDKLNLLQNQAKKKENDGQRNHPFDTAKVEIPFVCGLLCVMNASKYFNLEKFL